MGPDLIGIYGTKWPISGPDSGPEFTHVNLFSINYGGQNSGKVSEKLPVILVVDLMVIYGVNGLFRGPDLLT